MYLQEVRAFLRRPSVVRRIFKSPCQQTKKVFILQLYFYLISTLDIPNELGPFVVTLMVYK